MSVLAFIVFIALRQDRAAHAKPAIRLANYSPLTSHSTPWIAYTARRMILAASELVSFSVVIKDPIPDLKLRLVELIFEEIGEGNMWIAHHMLGLDQSRMWRLEHRRLDRFS